MLTAQAHWSDSRHGTNDIQMTSDNAYRVGRPYIGNGLPIMHHSVTTRETQA